jgi:hypothetical protein
VKTHEKIIDIAIASPSAQMSDVSSDQADYAVDLLISNLKGKYKDITTARGVRIPTLFPEVHPKSAYIGSPVSQYIRYAIREFSAGKSIVALRFYRLLETLAAGFFSALGLDKSIHLNHRLLSTSLPDADLRASNYWEAMLMLERSHPGHSVIVRGLNDMQHRHLLDEMAAYGGRLVLNRKIYLLDLRKGVLIKKRPLEQDMKRWEAQGELRWRKARHTDPAEVARCLSLYRMVYIDKHSELNPLYTPLFFETAVSTGLLEAEVLCDIHTDEVLAVQMYHRNSDTITTPFIGYDTAVPREKRLYPFLNLRLTRKALEERRILNMSSGAGEFKKQRGGAPSFEYLVVFDAHLSPLRRLAWQLLAGLSARFARPWLEKNDV